MEMKTVIKDDEPIILEEYFARKEIQWKNKLKIASSELDGRGISI